MFCGKCGQPLETEATFCQACGATVTAPTTAPVLDYLRTDAADDTPVYVLRPTFIRSAILLRALPLLAFAIPVSAVCCATVGEALGFLGIPCPPPLLFILMSLPPIAILPVTYFGQKRRYARTEYCFFANRLEYDEGFFFIRRTSIPYRDIHDVLWDRGIVEHRYGLCTIDLLTVPVDKVLKPRRCGIPVRDVRVSEHDYLGILNLIRQSHGWQARLDAR